MKSFVCAVCVFLAVTVFSVSSSVYIRKNCTEIELILSETAADETKFDTLYPPALHSWEKIRLYIRCTVSHKDSETLDNAFEELYSYHSSNSKSEYNAALTRLTSLIRELKNSEAFSVYAIG